MRGAAGGTPNCIGGGTPGWGSVSQDLVGEFTDVRGVAWRDLYYQTQLEREQRKVMGELMGSEYR